MTDQVANGHSLVDPISAIILAGGRGARLGGDKATLQLAGRTMLEHVGDLLATLSDDLIVVRRADQRLSLDGARVVADVLPDAGVLAAITAGLQAAHHDWSLVVACDMPFLSPVLIGYMLSQRTGHDIVVPRLEVGYEPLHALYQQRCLPALWEALRAGQRRVIAFYQHLRVRDLTPAEVAVHDPQGRSFYNINTPEELMQARKWLCHREGDAAR